MTQSTPEQAGACGRPDRCASIVNKGILREATKTLMRMSGPFGPTGSSELLFVACLERCSSHTRQIAADSLGQFCVTFLSSRVLARPLPRGKISRRVGARTPKWMLADANVINRILHSVAPNLQHKPTHCRTHRDAPVRTTLSSEPSDRSVLPGTNAVRRRLRQRSFSNASALRGRGGRRQARQKSGHRGHAEPGKRPLPLLSYALAARRRGLPAHLARFQRSSGADMER